MMMRRSLIIFLAVIFILPISVSWGEEISLTATVDRNTISLQDRLTYTLTIEGARDGQPVLPDIPGFQVLGSSVSTQFSLINNQTRVSRSIDYTLMPVEAGVFTIPSARLEYDGKTYTTRPVRVTVMAGAAPPAPPGPSSLPAARGGEETPEPASRHPLFIRTEVDRKEAYVNEQITLTFSIYSRGLRIANLNYSPPPTIGFTEESLGDQKNYGRILEGLRYEVVELPKAIFPISSGEVTIGSAELKGDIIVPRRSPRMSPFDDFFSDDFFGSAFAERQPFALRSNPIKLNIKPLPQDGRPDGFKGAVGEFRFDLSASPPAVRVGEPITVTMKVSGTGNLDAVALPEIPCGESFKTYAPEVETKRMIIGGRVGGEKTFKQVIIPLSVDAKEIPAVSFSYFDPAAGSYRTLEAKPVGITVEAAPDQGPLSLVEGAGAGPGREQIRILKKDILYIKDSPGRLFRAGRSYYRRPLFWFFPVAALTVLLGVWAVRSRRERLRSDVAYARQVGASRSARRRFKKARLFLREKDQEKFYGEVNRAFNRYLGDKWGLPSGAVSAGVIAGRLRGAGAPAELIEEMESCFGVFDLARFSGSSGERKEMESFLARLESLIGRLDKVKVK
ncbi:MAG: BatD family protein [PVC group bacterium]